jgi:hypothetical protein
MVGMGSVVTKSVPDFHLVLGSPARSIGAVCKCGLLFHKFADGETGTFVCECGSMYEIAAENVVEIEPEADTRRAVRMAQEPLFV